MYYDEEENNGLGFIGPEMLLLPAAIIGSAVNYFGAKATGEANIKIAKVNAAAAKTTAEASAAEAQATAESRALASKTVITIALIGLTGVAGALFIRAALNKKKR